MKGNHLLCLIFPLSIFFAGFMVLKANLDRGRIRTPTEWKIDSGTVQSRFREPVLINHPVAGKPESAFPYFLLASAFVLVIMALPRLQELSISEKSLVLKLVSELKEETSQAQADLPQGAQSDVYRSSPSSNKMTSIRAKIELLEQILKKGKQ